MTTVMIVDDHELIRQGLRRAFEAADGFEVLADVGSVADALRAVRETVPDVVIMDVRLPDGSGLDATRSLRAEHPGMGIVLLTMYSGDDHLFKALDAGASAFVPKSAPASEVVAAARHAVAAPGSFTAADLADAMRRRTQSTGPQLSPREQDVLELLADGLSVAQLSRRLYISESTAKTHITRLYEKVGASNRSQALMTALRLGLLPQLNGD